MKVARSAAMAAMVASLSVVCATARPLATAADTNLRQAPGTDSEKLALIPKGARVEVGNCSNGWCQVSWNGQNGYALARNVGMAPRPPSAPVGAVRETPAAAVEVASPTNNPKLPRGYTGPGTSVPAGPHTGYQYTGPYDERVVTSTNGVVIGTDPDPAIRAQLRRDGVGPDSNATGSGGP